jgi:hypothetical protein
MTMSLTAISDKIRTWRTITVVLLITHVIAASFGAYGYYSLFVKGKKPEIKIVEKKDIVTVPVYREYSQLSQGELTEKLTCYDTSEPRLDVAFKNNTAHLSAGLCERNWTRDVTFEIASSSNWKFTIGVAAVGVAAGGFLTYKIIKAHK